MGPLKLLDNALFQYPFLPAPGSGSPPLPRAWQPGVLETLPPFVYPTHRVLSKPIPAYLETLPCIP